MALSIAVTAHETGMGLLSPSLAAYDVHAVSDVQVHHGLPVHIIIAQWFVTKLAYGRQVPTVGK